MDFLRPAIKILFVLASTLLLQTALSVSPLYTICSASGNYLADEPFGENVRLLLGSLTTRVPPIGFGLGSIGKGASRVNALALCRGDVPSAACKTCVAEAGELIQGRCPTQKEAIIWFDNCLLRFSDVNFFGEIDDKNKFYMWNTQNVSDPIAFNGQVVGLMNQLTAEAYLTPLLFAAGEMELAGSEKLYGFAQCTRDLSGGDCKKCLEKAIGDLHSCCDGKRGGRVVGGSCNIRYESYPFLQAQGVVEYSRITH